MSRFITIIFGSVSCIISALLNFYIQDLTTINIFSFSIFFVIPVGAIVMGMAANSGYYFSALMTHRMLDKYDFITMVGMAAIGMLLIYYTEYYFYIIKEGLSHEITFLQYIALVVENSTLYVKFVKFSLFTKLGSIGGFGYLFLIIRFIGFIVGGAVVFLLLKGTDTCSKCLKYLRHKKKNIIFFENKQNFDNYQMHMDSLEPASQEFKSGIFYPHLQLDKVQDSIRYTWTFKKCPSCSFELLKGSAEIYKGKEWSAIKESERKIVMPTNAKLEQ